MSRIKKPIILVILLFLLSLPALSKGFAAELSPVVQSEIAHLLDYMEKSGCRFCRNGTWYNGRKSRERTCGHEVPLFHGKKPDRLRRRLHKMGGLKE